MYQLWAEGTHSPPSPIFSDLSPLSRCLVSFGRLSDCFALRVAVVGFFFFFALFSLPDFALAESAATRHGSHLQLAMPRPLASIPLTPANSERGVAQKTNG